MKITKFIAIILAVIVLGMSTLYGCSDKLQIEKTIYVKTDYDRGSMQAHFVNTIDDKTLDVEMELNDKNGDVAEYKISKPLGEYDMVSFTRDNTDETIQLSFSQYVSGWYISSYGVIPYVHGQEPIYDVEYKTVSLKYNAEKEKKIFIWVPDNYDKTQKYSVIYMTDGQNLFDRSSTSYGSWNVAQSVLSMNNIDKDTKTIIVGINDGDGNRDSELTPNIGPLQSNDAAFENGTGEEFSNFVYDVVVPYIEENYNVYTDSKHNSICGSSSGGIEAFYIGMEHPDKFGTIGALSPAFLLFSNDTWVKYLKTKDFSAGYPVVYIYNGGAEGDTLEKTLLVGAKAMKKNLSEINYPEDNIYEQYVKLAAHNETYWRAIFPRFLSLAFNIESENQLKITETQK